MEVCSLVCGLLTALEARTAPEESVASVRGQGSGVLLREGGGGVEWDGVGVGNEEYTASLICSVPFLPCTLELDFWRKLLFLPPLREFPQSSHTSASHA